MNPLRSFYRRDPPKPRKPEPTDGMTPAPRVFYCGFCGKGQHEVTQLIAGPTVFICNECVELCVDVLDGVSRFNEVRENGT